MINAIVYDSTGTTLKESIVDTFREYYLVNRSKYFSKEELRYWDEVKKTNGNNDPRLIKHRCVVYEKGLIKEDLKISIDDVFDDTIPSFEQAKETGNVILVFSKGTRGANYEMYKAIDGKDLSVYVTKAYSPHERKDVPEAYIDLVREAKEDGFNIISYVTDDPKEAKAAVESKTINKVYLIDRKVRKDSPEKTNDEYYLITNLRQIEENQIVRREK